jgi:prepilin-type processing-associated H-X9-DG protein
MTQPPAMPPPLQPQQDSAPLEYVRVEPAQRSNAVATASLVCSLLVFVPYVTGLLAVILGRMGLLRAGELGGRGRAVARAGFIIGIVNIALWVMLSIAAVPAVARARQQAMRVQCASNMRQLSIAIAMYAQDNKGMVPPNLDVLGKYFGPGAAQVHTCPDAAAHGVPPATTTPIARYSYVYIVPPVPRLAQIRMPSTVPAIYEPLANHGGRGINVVYWDGHVEWHTGASAQRVLAQLQALQAQAAQAAQRTQAPPPPTAGPE